MSVEYHKDSDGHLMLDENDELIPDTICICAAWNESECCCGAWMKKDYYDWDKDENC